MDKSCDSSLLCIDIGNTTIGMCLYKNALSKSPLSIIKISSSPVKKYADYQKIVSGFLTKNRSASGSIDIVISSVVPALTNIIKRTLKSISKNKPLIVSHRISTGLTFGIPDPSSTGADRIANAAAAFACFNTPCIVVDCGSATTITVVGSQGLYLGGAILPGIDTMLRSLHKETAKLRTKRLSADTKALGSDTDSAISSGIIIGSSGAVSEIISRIIKETGLRFRIILTGGHAELIRNHIKMRHILVKDLIFEGLRTIHNKNR